MNLYQRLLMAKDAALGLNWLHKSVPAIIHSDLKLENLMVLCGGGGVCVACDRVESLTPAPSKTV